MNPFKSLENYRSFKANNRYSYPFFFFVIAALKNFLQLTVLAVAGWSIFQIADGKLMGQPVVERMVQSPVASKPTPVSQHLAANVPVEVLAVDSNKPVLLVKPIIGVDPLDSTPVIEAPVIVKEPGGIVSWSWIFKQDENKFTIQFGSSPDEQRIRMDAASFPTTEAVIVFPFKKTPSKRTVYGFSTGLYDSLEDAQKAIEGLPESVQSFGPWIRPIGQLQKQIVLTLAD